MEGRAVPVLGNGPLPAHNPSRQVRAVSELHERTRAQRGLDAAEGMWGEVQSARGCSGWGDGEGVGSFAKGLEVSTGCMRQ